MGGSEFDTKPQKLVVCHPKYSSALKRAEEKDLGAYNFVSLPQLETLYDEYDGLIAKIHELGISTVDLHEILGKKASHDSFASPNTMFTRDSAITLPWAPGLYIESRFALKSREPETETMSTALRALGLNEFCKLSPGSLLEGGDVIAVMHNLRRMIFIGYGSRTNEQAVEELAKQLIPDHADVVVGIKHPDSILHLDTGFSVLPRQIIVMAPSMLGEGVVFGYGKKAQAIDLNEYLTTLGFNIITAPSDGDGAYHEYCNMLPIGDNNYLSFPLPYEFKKQLEDAAYIWIHEVEGSEILKTAGGIHCLTRPIY